MIIIFNGSVGIGKTSVSTAFGLTYAEREQRRRITARRTSGWRWELERASVLNAVS